MSITRKKSFATRTVSKSNNNTVDPMARLLSRSDPRDFNVVFTHYDGSSRTLGINTEFVKNDKGRRISASEITFKLNTLKHDFNAEKYEIKNLAS